MKGLPIGYASKWEKMRYEVRKQGRKKPGESSGILIGPARSGKGTDVLMPMLLEYEGSMVVIDPKGQNAAITAAHRQKNLKQNVIMLNPFNVWPEYIGQFTHAGVNPILPLDAESDGFGVDCDALAEGLVPVKPGENDPHFPESAQAALSGTIMTVARDAPTEVRNLASVFEIISGPKFFEFARDAVKRGDPLISGRLGRFAVENAHENKELVGIQSLAITNLRFVGNKAMLRSLSGSTKGQASFNWSDLRKRPTTVYVILPVGYLETCRRWLRLCIASALNELLVAETRGIDVLLLMDEFAALGHLPIIENTMALSAGMGLTMLPVLQDLQQLRGIYGDRTESFLSVAGYQMFLRPRDLATAEMISRMTGQMEVVSQSRSVSMDHNTGEPHVTDSSSQQPSKVMSVDDVMAMPNDEMLLRVDNVPNMILAKRRPYYECPEYRGMWSPDPYHVTSKRKR